MPDVARPHRLYTWSWKAALAYAGDDLVLVRTSLGKPKWIPERVADEFPYIGELAPAGCFQIRDDAAFRRCYFKRLDGYGVERIERRLRAIVDTAEGRSLALLCFETHPSQCHRGDFSEWWLQKTGELVPEFDPAPPVPPAPPAPEVLF